MTQRPAPPNATHSSVAPSSAMTSWQPSAIRYDVTLRDGTVVTDADPWFPRS